MKRIIVTGANKGIGLAIANRILSDHEETEVLLGSRNLDRGQVARDSMVTSNPSWSTRLRVLPLDVSDEESVSNACKQVQSSFRDEERPLYGIVNNAGIGMNGEHLSEVLAVNVYGIRRVCAAFAPLLDPEVGRIVNLTSASGPNFVAKCSQEQQAFFLDSKIEWDALHGFMGDCVALDGDKEKFRAQGLSDGENYGLSKACANSLTFILARQHPDFFVNACTPGFIESDLTRALATSQGKSPVEMGMKPPAHGTASALFLLFGDLEGSGNYYGSDTLRSPMDRYRAPGTPAFTGAN